MLVNTKDQMEQWLRTVASSLRVSPGKLKAAAWRTKSATIAMVSVMVKSVVG